MPYSAKLLMQELKQAFLRRGGGAAEGGGGSKGMKFLNAPVGMGLHALYFAFPFGEGGSPKG